MTNLELLLTLEQSHARIYNFAHYPEISSAAANTYALCLERLKLDGLTPESLRKLVATTKNC